MKRFHAGIERLHWNTEVFQPFVLVLSMLNRSHFDYWADFHTDSAAVFAYLEKSVRRLVNCHQSRNGHSPPRLPLLREQQPAQVKRSSWRQPMCACASEEFTRYKNNLSSRIYTFFKVINLTMRGADWNLNMILWLMKMVSCERERALFEGGKVKREGYVGTQYKGMRVTK